jgi:hypothetical protein
MATPHVVSCHPAMTTARITATDSIPTPDNTIRATNTSATSTVHHTFQHLQRHLHNHYHCCLPSNTTSTMTTTKYLGHNHRSCSARADPITNARVGGDTAHTVTVKEGSSSVTLDDVLFGDVWVCSGQSNMAFLLENAFNGSALVPHITYVPHITRVPCISHATCVTHVSHITHVPHVTYVTHITHVSHITYVSHITHALHLAHAPHITCVHHSHC